MAYPDDIYGVPSPAVPDPYGGYSTLSDDDYLATLAGMDAALSAPRPLQPGLGIPQESLEAAQLGAPASIPMPEAPDAPLPLSPPEVPPEWLPPQGPAEDMTQPPAPGLQPGLGIPAHLVEPAALPPPIDYDEGEGLLPDQPDRELGRAQLDAQLAGMNPVQAAQDRAQQAEDDKYRAARAQSEAARLDAEQEDRSLQAYVEGREQTRKERAEIDAEAKALANETIGADDWYEEGGISRSVGAFVAAVVGGLVQGRTGGPNIGMAMIDKQIERYIATKQADRAHKRELLGDRRRGLAEEMGDVEGDYRFAEVVRKASYERALKQIETDAANYDPEGTAGRARDNARREVMAKMTAADAAAAAEQLKRNVEKRKAELEEQKAARDEKDLQEKIRNNKAQTASSNYGISSANKRAKDQLALDEKKLAAEEAKDKRTVTKAEEAEVRELGMGGSVRVMRDPTTNAPIIGRDGKPMVEKGPLLNEDGRPWKGKDKTQSDALAKSAASAEGLVDILDEIAAIRNEVGGESSVFNSKHRQRLDTLRERATLMRKSGTEGLSSDADMARIERTLGTDNAASFRDQAAKLAEGREGIISEHNRAMRIRGQYTGDPITFENKYASAPANTKAEEQLKSWQKKPQISRVEADRQATAIVKKRYTPEQLRDPAIQKQFSAEVNELKADYKDITPEQKAQIAELGNLGGGPAAEKAEKDLRDIAENGQSPKIREAALSALLRWQAAQRAAIAGGGGQ